MLCCGGICSNLGSQRQTRLELLTHGAVDIHEICLNFLVFGSVKCCELKQGQLVASRFLPDAFQVRKGSANNFQALKVSRFLPENFQVLKGSTNIFQAFKVSAG